MGKVILTEMTTRFSPDGFQQPNRQIFVYVKGDITPKPPNLVVNTLSLTTNETQPGSTGRSREIQTSVPPFFPPKTPAAVASSPSPPMTPSSAPAAFASLLKAVEAVPSSFSTKGRKASTSLYYWYSASCTSGDSIPFYMSLSFTKEGGVVLHRLSFTLPISFVLSSRIFLCDVAFG
ncbi:hypothetical protein BKA57DRAFT_468891 [Linnemannia elongata]|nr:hypothetical protein BKA57DRAFT_468891 [Linnemannia elongata]